MRIQILAAAALLAATPLATAQDAPPRAGRPPRYAASVASTSVIRGRVTSVTGGAVRGAEVRAREVNGRENRLVTTDETGAFELRDVVAGSWNLTVSKSGFITQQYGQKRPFARPEPLQVGERQQLQADFTLGRAGAISGRVLDEFGDPVAGARVQVLRLRYARGRRMLSPTGVGDQTDDTGAFRLYALPPGDYYVGAAQRAATPESPLADTPIGAQTYYPGTTSLAEAQRIRLGVGEELPSVTFSLAAARPVRVSGTVLSAKGGPAEDASVRLVNATDFSLVGTPLGNFGMSQANGAFTFVNVVPGTYVLEAHSGSAFGPLADGSEDASMPVVIGTEDVTGLTITTAPAGAITGRVTTENGATPPPGVQIQVEATSGGMQFDTTVDARPRPAAPGAIGTLPPYSFRLPLTAGGFHLRVAAPDGWMLKAVEIDGADVTDQPVELRGGNRDARVVLTDRVTQLDGLVRDGNAPLVAVPVVVFPDEPALWTYPSRYVRVLETGRDGGVRIRGLPPHAGYLAVALDYVDDGEAQDPEFLAGLRDLATRFSLDYGEARTLALRPVERR